jgi:hypothetical protein
MEWALGGGWELAGRFSPSGCATAFEAVYPFFISPDLSGTIKAIPVLNKKLNP